jgi:hypothetical protein
MRLTDIERFEPADAPLKASPLGLALDLASLDVGSIAAISGGDEIASLTSGHAVADMSASCCCETSSCCTCI